MGFHKLLSSEKQTNQWIQILFLLAVFLLMRDMVGIISWMKQDWDRMVVNNLISYPIFPCGGVSSYWNHVCIRISERTILELLTSLLLPSNSFLFCLIFGLKAKLKQRQSISAGITCHWGSNYLHSVWIISDLTSMVDSVTFVSTMNSVAIHLINIWKLIDQNVMTKTWKIMNLTWISHWIMTVLHFRN